MHSLTCEATKIDERISPEYAANEQVACAVAGLLTLSHRLRKRLNGFISYLGDIQTVGHLEFLEFLAACRIFVPARLAAAPGPAQHLVCSLLNFHESVRRLGRTKGMVSWMNLVCKTYLWR